MAKKRGPKGPSKYTQEFLEAEAEALVAWYEIPDNIFLKNFAISRKYPSEYLSRFADRNEKFNQAYNRAKDIQEMRLVERGITGKYNPYFTGLTLKNVAGWRDKQDVDHTTKGEKIDGINYIKPKQDGQDNASADNQAGSGI